MQCIAFKVRTNGSQPALLPFSTPKRNTLMRKIAFGLLLMTVVCGGEARSLAEDSPAPTQEVLTIVSDTKWQLTTQVAATECKLEEFAFTVTVPVTMEVTETVNGKPVKKVMNKNVQETRTGVRSLPVCSVRMQSRTVDPKNVKAFEISGKEISAEQVAKRCKGHTLVAVSRGKGMISQSYSRLFKDGTIILAVQSHPQAMQALQPVGALSKPAAPELPQGPQPSLMYASTDGGEQIKIRRLDQLISTGTAMVFEGDAADGDGKALTLEQVSQQSTITSVPWSVVRMSAPASKSDVPVQTAKTAFSNKERIVLMSADGKVVDEFWLQNFKSFVPVVRGVVLPISAPTSGFAAPQAPPAPQPMPYVPAVPQSVPAPLPQAVEQAPSVVPPAPVTAP